MFWIWQESCRDHLNNNDITLYFPNKGIRCYLLDLCQVNILQTLSLSPSLIFRLHYSYSSKQNNNCGLHSEVVPYNFLLSGHSVLMFILLFLLDSIRLETCSCILIKPLNDDNKNLKMWLVDILSHRLIYWNRDMYLPKKHPIHHLCLCFYPRLQQEYYHLLWINNFNKFCLSRS